jgi:hypothetical protein
VYEYEDDMMTHVQISELRRPLFDKWVGHIKQIYEYQISQVIAYQGFREHFTNGWGFKRKFGHYSADDEEEGDLMMNDEEAKADVGPFYTYQNKLKEALVNRRTACTVFTSIPSFVTRENTPTLDDIHFALASILIDIEVVKMLRRAEENFTYIFLLDPIICERAYRFNVIPYSSYCLLSDTVQGEYLVSRGYTSMSI